MQPLLNNIVHKKLKAEVEADLSFGTTIRENAYRRIETVFRWKTVSQKLKALYLYFSGLS